MSYIRRGTFLGDMLYVASLVWLQKVREPPYGVAPFPRRQMLFYILTEPCTEEVPSLLRKHSASQEDICGEGCMRDGKKLPRLHSEQPS